MNNRYDISVVVVTYHADWRKLKLTLLSVLRQKDIRYEIVIADDGSDDNHEQDILKLFGEYSFTDYKLDMHPENAGTVRNLLSGCRKAEGYYIKGIGQGDMLYDEHTLRDMVEYARVKNASVVFGDAVLVDLNSGDLEPIIRPAVPYRTDIYDDPLQVKREYLVFMDRPYGCTPIAERQLFTDCLERAAGRIIYGEDLMYDVMAAEGVKMAFFERPVTVYDYGARNEERTSFNMRLEKDVHVSETMIADVLTDGPLAEQRRKAVELRYEPDKAKRILKQFGIPGMIGQKLRRKLFPRRTNNTVPAWLKEAFEEEMHV